MRRGSNYPTKQATLRRNVVRRIRQKALGLLQVLAYLRRSEIVLAVMDKVINMNINKLNILNGVYMKLERLIEEAGPPCICTFPETKEFLDDLLEKQEHEKLIEILGYAIASINSSDKRFLDRADLEWMSITDAIHSPTEGDYTYALHTGALIANGKLYGGSYMATYEDVEWEEGETAEGLEMYELVHLAEVGYGIKMARQIYADKLAIAENKK